MSASAAHRRDEVELASGKRAAKRGAVERGGPFRVDRKAPRSIREGKGAEA